MTIKYDPKGMVKFSYIKIIAQIELCFQNNALSDVSKGNQLCKQDQQNQIRKSQLQVIKKQDN